MKFVNKIFELVKEAKECNFITPFVLPSLLEKIEKKTEAEINIFTLPKTCELLESKFKDINFIPVIDEGFQLHSKFYLVKKDEEEYKGIFGSPNLTGTSLEVFFEQDTRYSYDKLKWSEKDVLAGISKKMNDLISEWNIKIKCKKPISVYNGNEFFKELTKTFENKLSKENRKFLFVTHQFRVGFFEKTFKDLKGDEITIITRKNLDGEEGKKYLNEEFPNLSIIETNKPIHGKVFCGYDNKNIVISCGSSNLTYSAKGEGKYAKKETNIIISSPIEIAKVFDDDAALFRFLIKSKGLNPGNSKKISVELDKLYKTVVNAKIRSKKDLLNLRKEVKSTLGEEMYRELLKILKTNNRKIRKNNKKFMEELKIIKEIENKQLSKFDEMKKIKELYSIEYDIDVINRANVTNQIIKNTKKIIEEVKKEKPNLNIPNIF